MASSVIEVAQLDSSTRRHVYRLGGGLGGNMNNVPDKVHLDWSLLGAPIVEAVASLRADIETYAKSPGGVFFTPDQQRDVDHALDQIVARVKDSMPYAVCPNQPNCRRGCKVCEGAGFLPRRLKMLVKKGVTE